MQRGIVTNLKCVFNKKKTEATIYIYDEIGDFYDWATGQRTGINFQNFNETFTTAEASADRINIKISSLGGSVYEGDKIFNLIANSTKDVHTYAVGLCASMSAMLTQAVKKGNRHASKDAKLMFHSASTFLYGYQNSSQLRKEADALDIYDRTFTDILADKLGQAKEDVQAKYFNGDDNYFTANEALDLGLVDVVEPYASDMSVEASAGENIIHNYMQKVAARGNSITDATEQNIFDRVIAHFNSVLPNLRDKESYTNIENKTKMDFTNLKAQLVANATTGITLTAAQIAELMPEVEAVLSGTLLTEAEVQAKLASATELATAPLTARIAELEANIPAPAITQSGAGTDGGAGSPTEEDDADTIAAGILRMPVAEYRKKIGKA